MRKVLHFGVLGALLLLLALLPGCTGMVQEELDLTHAKLAALQELAASVNKELTTLDRIVAALDDGHTILPGSFEETEDGYEISFRDGKKIFVPFGKDGVDGRILIPVGVRLDEDGIYYWTVDGEWLLDAEGNRMRAGAAEGEDGIAPQVKVEDGFWWISVDGGETFTQLASCEEMDGVGVFSGIDLSDPAKILLTLWDGTSIELPCRNPLKLSFTGAVQDTVLIAGGETLTIPYEVIVEGESEEPLIVTAGTDGVYVIEGLDTGKGEVKVTAPTSFAEGYILLSAFCDGYSALKMISFREREVAPSEPVITVRIGSGADTCVVAYKTNFEYQLSSPDGDWLQAVSDPESGTVTFTAAPNTGNSVRSCTVTVSPANNPGYTTTTFQVLQATDSRTYSLDPGTAFSFDPETLSLTAPAEGGDADIWITSSSDLVASVPETQDWAQATLASEAGFWHLKVHVDALPAETERTGSVTLFVQTAIGNIPIGEIKIIQR